MQAYDSPVANLFCDLPDVTQNKRPLIPRDKSGHTPARKKHGGVTSRASSVQAQEVIQVLLAAELSSMHVDNSFDGIAKSSDMHHTIVTPDCNNADDGINESNDEDYHPPSVAPRKQKKIKPKIVLNCSFMTFLCPSTFNNQLFRKGQPQVYTNEDIAAFDNNVKEQLHFNFAATRML